MPDWTQEPDGRVAYAFTFRPELANGATPSDIPDPFFRNRAVAARSAHLEQNGHGPATLEQLAEQWSIAGIAAHADALNELVAAQQLGSCLSDDQLRDDLRRIGTATFERRLETLSADVHREARTTGEPVPLVFDRRARQLFEPLTKLAGADSAPVRPVAAPFVPFPVDVLSSSVKKFAVETADAIGCDASYLALPCLIAAAGMIGTTRRCEVRRGWTEPSVLWGAIVGDSGSAKSPAIRAVMRPVHVIHEALREKAKKERKEWDDEVRALKKGEPRPDRPPDYRRIAEDTSIEAMQDGCCDNPRGLLAYADELATWFGSFTRWSKSSERGHWLKLYDAGPLDIARMTRESRYVPHAAVSILGGIQPGILARLLGCEEHESGLAARFLWTCPPEAVPGWAEHELSPKAGIGWEKTINFLNTLSHRDEAVPLSKDALVLAKLHVDENAEAIKAKHGPIKATYAKAKGLPFRLALVLHYMRAADKGNEGGGIDGDSMRGAIKLTHWFRAEADRLFPMLEDTGGDDDELLRWVERRGSVSPRQLAKSGPRSHRGQTPVAEATLEGLVDAGKLERVHGTPGPLGGRPTRQYRIRDSGPMDPEPETPTDEAVSHG